MLFDTYLSSHWQIFILSVTVYRFILSAFVTDIFINSWLRLILVSYALRGYSIIIAKNHGFNSQVQVYLGSAPTETLSSHPSHALTDSYLKGQNWYFVPNFWVDVDKAPTRSSPNSPVILHQFIWKRAKIGIKCPIHFVRKWGRHWGPLCWFWKIKTKSSGRSKHSKVKDTNMDSFSFFYTSQSNMDFDIYSSKNSNDVKRPNPKWSDKALMMMMETQIMEGWSDVHRKHK